MSEKEHTENSRPSAPPEDPSSNLTDESTTTSPPNPQLLPPQPGLLLGSPPPVSDGMGMPPYREPPPSYQAAMAYPAVSLPYSTNPDGSTFPKPPYGALPPYPIPPVTSQQFPLPSPPPPPPLSAPAINPQSPAITVARVTRGNCAYCGDGIVSGQTDLCCLICLVLLAICTFPIGLLFLCFIPCTVHKRCSNCHRIG